MSKGASDRIDQPASRKRRRLIHLEQLIYRTAGLPLALRGAAGGKGPTQYLIPVFIRSFWQLRHIDQWLELICSVALLVISVPATIAVFTMRNGPVIRQRHGTSIQRQILDQLKLYVGAGVLSPWYYMFELHFEPSKAHALSYLYRFQTHGGLYSLLRPSDASPLNDKKAFADRCTHSQISHVPYLLAIESGSAPTGPLPPTDLFVKPRNARGGRGAERWDYLGEGWFEGPRAERLTGQQLLHRLASAAQRRSLLVQPRLSNHRELADLSSGALSTVRIMTCLDESDEPEVVGAAFRMSIGANRTVDNFHAGGIASAVSDEGKLGPATDAGLNVALGWLTNHPTTGAEIEGRSLPLWAEVKTLAASAHRAFHDRKLIGWDIAITNDGPVIIEGNSSADLDILQRTARSGLAQSRLAELMAFHIKKRLG